jgi:acyl transferase domain-containing protein/NAD(P)-dependent dehydrogenase (short-subunit alcohol dehydrogenase family)
MTDHTFEPLAIVGIGCIFPGAPDAAAYWRNIRDGVDAITEIPPTHWNPADYFNPDQKTPDMTYAMRGGFIGPVAFDPLYYGISPNNIEATDTTQLLGLVATREALRDAGYATGRDSNDGRPFDRDRASVILGVTGTLELVIPLGARLGHPLWRRALRDAGVADAMAEDVVRRIGEGYVPWQENSFPGLLGNVAAGRIANRFDLGGTNCVVDAACASSLGAIHMAALELHSGRCDMAITGGLDTFNDIFMYMCFSKTPALSPTGNSRPFHKEGDGTILGEGLGVVILKRLADAERDHDRIYAAIRGLGSSSDGKGNAIYAPSANGQRQSLRRAYAEAGVSPATVELVEAHGTGTRVGDAVEAEALSGVYREARDKGTWCAIGSVKSMIGHTKAAAGVAGLIKVALALQHKVLPPTLKVDEPLETLQPGTAPVYVNTIKRPWVHDPTQPRRAAVSAFGFGGSNFHAVLEEHGHAKPAIEWDGRVLVFAFGAADRAGLERQIQGIDPAQDWMRLRVLAAESVREFDPSLPCRLVLIAEQDRTSIAGLLQGARARLATYEPHWRTTDSAFFGMGPAPGKLALLFPGQGAQYTGMLRDLACQFPEFLAVLEEADRAIDAAGADARLSDRIYPIPVFTDAARAENEAALRQTANAQPAIGAVSLGALRVLRHFGIEPESCAGHSFGELTALRCAGVYEDREFLLAARRRGELMQRPGGDQGGMLAVIADTTTVLNAIEEAQLDLIIANHNAPNQLVLSGATAQIERAATLFKQRKIQARVLPVAAAFHSSFVAAAEQPLAEFLDSINMQGATIPVYANTTALPYPEDPAAARALLAGQLARPVEFVKLIENMHAAGRHTFIEAGPSAILTGLVQSILHNKPHAAIALDASKGKRPGQFDLACALAQIATLGHPCQLARWDEGFLAQRRPDPEPKLSVQLTGANYVLPRKPTPPVAAVAAPVKEIRVTERARPSVAGTATDPRLATESILALQKMQEQTAELHRRYLEGMEESQRAIRALLLGQAGMTEAIIGAPMTPAPVQAAHASITTAAPQQPAIAAPRPEPFARPHENILLEVVAEKTGYPLEMLSLNMSLDTDLGIDSIKRVEILSALQERVPGMRQIPPEELGTFQLLQHIVEFMAATHPDAEVVASIPPASAGTAIARPTRELQETLLAVVAEKTGYPVEMLNLDMQLDADLGIDSIKRVEILSALQERLPQAPTVSPEDLGRLHTLAQILEHMSAGTSSAPVTQTLTATADAQHLQAALLAVVAEKTGYPVEMLNLDMQLDADLGIDSIKRVEILSAIQERLPEAPIVSPEDLGRLQTLRQIGEHLGRGKTAVSTAPVTAPVEMPQHAPAQELYRGILELVPLPTDRPGLTFTDPLAIEVCADGTAFPDALVAALRDAGVAAAVVSIEQATESEAAGLVISAPVDAADVFIEQSFLLIKKRIPHLQLLTGITRLGGAFGLKEMSGMRPEAAGLAGLVKTAGREWPELHVRQIDLPGDGSEMELAPAIATELLTTGPVETGITARGATGLRLASVPQRLVPVMTNPFPPGSTAVISGGARGVTAEIAAALARDYGLNLLLLGRSPLPGPEPDWAKDIPDEVALKRAIIERHNADRLSPAELKRIYREHLAAREIRANLQRMEQTGARVRYESVDVRDLDQVAGALQRARDELGPIRALIHGAGVLADALIADKTLEHFRAVWSTKVDGLRALLAATAADELALLALFSSSTARFGRKGQADYAAANEALNKLSQRYRIDHPACRALSINWGPWDGGMVTPGLKRLFTAEGMEVIPLAAGAQYLMREIAGTGPVEQVILASPPPADRPSPPEQTSTPQGLQPAFARHLDIDSAPILGSHIMNGHAVLPAAIVGEWLAHGAMHTCPGMNFLGIEALRIYKGVTLDGGTGIDLQILAGAPQHNDKGEDRVAVELRSGDTLHAGAIILLGGAYPEAPALHEPPITGVYPFRKREYYGNDSLFHGPGLEAIHEVGACGPAGIRGRVAAAPAPALWLRHPIRSDWLADPMMLDGAFQLLILWSLQQRGAPCLPAAIQSYRQYRRRLPKDEIWVIARIRKQSPLAVTATIEFQDRSGVLLARMEGCECIGDAGLKESFLRNQLVQSPEAQ